MRKAGPQSWRTPARRGFVGACLLLLQGPLVAQAPGTDLGSSAPPAEASVKTETFEPVRIRRSVRPDFPAEARIDHQEGWVNVQFMVSPQGQPAVLDGQPIDSAVTMKMKFEMPGQVGAHDGYVHAFQALNRTIDANDRNAADAALAKLQITNLYEDAYYGLAQYSYALKWGDADGQRAGSAIRPGRIRSTRAAFI